MASRGPVDFAIRVSPMLFFALLPIFIWFMPWEGSVIGYAIGAGTSFISLVAAKLVVGWVIRREGGKLPAISALQLALLVKLPFFAIVIFFTNSLGLGAIEGFLGGYLLVYLALVLGAILSKDAPTGTSDE